MAGVLAGLALVAWGYQRTVADLPTFPVVVRETVTPSPGATATVLLPAGPGETIIVRERVSGPQTVIVVPSPYATPSPYASPCNQGILGIGGDCP